VATPLELGEAFAGELDRLSDAIVRATEAEYGRLEPDDEGRLQPSFVVAIARIAELLEVGGRSAGELANGYVRALADEAGATVTTGPASAVMVDPFGRTVGEIIGSVPGKVYLALEQGMALEEALPIGGHAMSSIAETWVRDAARIAIGAVVKGNEPVRWRWWSRGTCGACMALDDGRARGAGFQIVHPNCQCVPEPVVPPAPLDADALAEEFGIDLDISETDDILTVSRIVVPKAARGQGIGTRAMERILEYADQAGKTVALSPATDFGGTLAGLRRFYGRLGFRKNAGRLADFRTRESMVRDPVMRPTGADRFAAMSRAEQDAALGPETAELVRTGKVELRELVERDPLGRVEQIDLEDVE
jgi:GNAT superfamily N-acetyltransferase